MKRSRALFLNTILLTATSLLMRAVALAFQVYLSKTIGAAGIGLYMLTMSVNMFAATFAISGIRFTSMRLVAEELGKRNSDGIRRAVRYCMVYAVFFGLLAFGILYNFAEIIGTRFNRRREDRPIAETSLVEPAVCRCRVCFIRVFHSRMPRSKIRRRADDRAAIENCYHNPAALHDGRK